MSNKCEVCNVNEHKYKCPRCSMKTCSLECCKKHKTNTGCDGQRDKTKFINKSEFDEQALLSDYKFLEEQARLIDLHQRGVFDPATSTTTTTTTNSMQENLRKFVYSQFKINLKLMPYQSTRHLNNKTRFNRSANTVSWSLEFAFHLNMDEKLFRFNTKTQLYSSIQPLRSILNKFYKDFKMDLFENTKAKEAKYKLLYEKFYKAFEKEQYDDFNVLFQIIDMNLKEKYFIKLDLDKSLEHHLYKKSFIEYPTLFLVHKNDIDDYVIKNTLSLEEDLNNENQKSATQQQKTEETDENDNCEEKQERENTKMDLSEPSVSVKNGNSTNGLVNKTLYKRPIQDDLEEGECESEDSDDENENLPINTDSKRTIIDVNDNLHKKIKGDLNI